MDTGLHPAAPQGASGQDRAAERSAIRAPRSNASVVVASTAAAALCVSAFAGVSAAVPRKNSPYQKLALLTRVMSYVEQSYVEEVDPDELVYGAIKGMVETLDPHSSFLRPEQYRDIKNETSGQFSGVGLEVEARDGALTILQVLEGSPAARVGIQSGDQILRIDDQPTRGMTDYVQRMRGKRGTAVQLSVLRKGHKEPRVLVITRDIVKLRSVEFFTLEPGFGVIKIKQFTETTDKDVEAAMSAIERESGGRMLGLVLDVRNNPGGLLDQAVRIADLFIESGLIVRTEGRNGRVLDEEKAHARGTRVDFPMICLVNGGSASAAEILAGALQDHGRSLVMGTQTFGKGSVQTIIELDDGSALKLTIARYFSPSGRSIQEKGITPDVIIEQVKFSALVPQTTDEPQQRERDLQGHLKNKQADLARRPSGPAPGYAVIAQHAPQGEDFQLRTAYDYLKAWGILAARSSSTKPYPVRVASGQSPSADAMPLRDNNKAQRTPKSNEEKIEANTQSPVPVQNAALPKSPDKGPQQAPGQRNAPSQTGWVP